MTTVLIAVMMILAAVGAALSVIVRAENPGQIRTPRAMWNSRLGRWSILALAAAVVLAAILIFGPAHVSHTGFLIVASIAVGAIAGAVIVATRRRRHHTAAGDTHTTRR